MYEATLKFLLNFIGLLSSGSGAFILAYDIFSFRKKYPYGTVGSIGEESRHKSKNENLIKVAMFLIPLGVVFQLLALFIDQ